MKPKKNEDIMETMFKEDIKKYQKPVRIWKLAISTLSIGFLMVLMLLMIIGAYYVLCFLFS